MAALPPHGASVWYPHRGRVWAPGLVLSSCEETGAVEIQDLLSNANNYSGGGGPGGNKF